MNLVIANNYREYVRMTKLATMQVLANVEDKKTFSTLRFLKLQLRNCLKVKMDFCVFRLSTILQAPKPPIPGSHRGLEKTEDLLWRGSLKWLKFWADFQLVVYSSV